MAREPDGGSEVAALVARYDLAVPAERQLNCLVDLLMSDPSAPTAIRTRQGVLDDHLADSLIALELEPVRTAQAALDLGSGAGLPGLPLAIARPEGRFTLLESSSRKCRFLRLAVEVCEVSNVEVVHERAETFEAGRSRYDLVTVRAVSSLSVNAEYAAPLLHTGGAMVGWHGRRDPAAEADLSAAAAELGFGALEVKPVRPYPGAEHRHLYLLTKLKDTPTRFPRRPGMARKRPLGAQVSRNQMPSDRVER